MASSMAIQGEGAWDAIRSASSAATRVATSSTSWSRSSSSLNADLVAVELGDEPAHPLDGRGCRPGWSDGCAFGRQQRSVLGLELPARLAGVALGVEEVRVDLERDRRVRVAELA